MSSVVPPSGSQAIRGISVIGGGEFVWRTAWNGGSPATGAKAPPHQSDVEPSQFRFFRDFRVFRGGESSYEEGERLNL